MKPHGTAQRYRQHACRCTPCSDAHRLEAQKYRRRKALGQTNSLVDASDIAEAIAAAQDRGWSKYNLSRALNYDRRSLQRLLHSDNPRMHRETRERLLSTLGALGNPDAQTLQQLMTESRLGPARAVPALPYVSMLKSLLGNGHPGEKVLRRMQELGFEGQYMPLTSGKNVNLKMYVATARVITKAHSDLYLTLGPSWRTAARMYRNGWFPAGCYDEDDPDYPLIPEAVPDPADFLASWAGLSSPGAPIVAAAGLRQLGEPGSKQYEQVLGNLNRRKALAAARARPARLERLADQAARERRDARSLWSQERRAREVARVRAWKDAQQAS